MQRLAGLGAPVMVLAEYGRGHWMADADGKARDFPTTGQGPCLRGAGRRPVIYHGGTD